MAAIFFFILALMLSLRRVLMRNTFWKYSLIERGCSIWVDADAELKVNDSVGPHDVIHDLCGWLFGVHLNVLADVFQMQSSCCCIKVIGAFSKVNYASVRVHNQFFVQANAHPRLTFRLRRLASANSLRHFLSSPFEVTSSVHFSFSYIVDAAKLADKSHRFRQSVKIPIDSVSRGKPVWHVEDVIDFEVPRDSETPWACRFSALAKLLGKSPTQ